MRLWLSLADPAPLHKCWLFFLFLSCRFCGLVLKDSARRARDVAARKRTGREQPGAQQSCVRPELLERPMSRPAAQEHLLTCSRARSGPCRFCLVPVFPLVWGWGKSGLCFPMYRRPSMGPGTFLPLGKPQWALPSGSVFGCSLVNPLLWIKHCFVHFY